MAGITEEETWDNDVYQLEITDPVRGGPEGIDNLPHKALANRTVWLKAQLLLKALKGGSSTQLFKVKAGIANDEAVNKQQMETALSSALLVGVVIPFPIATVPNGYLECNGAELSRTVYSDLFTVIGETYGAGDGSTTFNIPDLRGEFIRGFDNGRGVDSGRFIGSLQLDQNKEHSHTYMKALFSNSTYSGSNSGIRTSQATNTTSLSGGDESRPRNIAMMYIIKY